jgi:hypothetical protein
MGQQAGKVERAQTCPGGGRPQTRRDPSYDVDRRHRVLHRHSRLHPYLRPRGRTNLPRAVAEIVSSDHAAASCGLVLRLQSARQSEAPHPVGGHNEQSAHRKG